MAVKYPTSTKKWICISLLLLLFIMTYRVLVFASESKKADANQTSADANKQSDQKQKTPRSGKVLRPEHTHPAFTQRVDERQRLVDIYICGEGVHDPNVIKAMRTVPRHAFVLRSYLHQAYWDHPLPIGLGQTISQPYIVAYMTEALRLGADSNVLEVGTGSGYQAAVCAEIAREVYTIEILDELAKSAEECLKELGYRNVSVRAADGYFGWKEKGPYDAIIITCTAGFVPPPLIEQLKPGGRMILPLGSPFGAQTLVLITKDAKGRVKSRSLLPVQFVPMVGQIDKAERQPRK